MARTPEEIQKWRDELLSDANDKIEKLVNSDKFKLYLATMARFHRYSSNNIAMIYAQNPDAKNVASFNKWKELGRTVNKGEKSIRILAPIFKKRKDIEREPEKLTPEQKEQEKVVGYRLVPVFDISQTEGQHIFSPEDFVKENIADETVLRATIKAVKGEVEKKTGFEIREEVIASDAKGWINFDKKEIVLDEFSNDALKLQTLFHEFAHYQLHEMDKGMPLPLIEAEAESVAYASMTALGVDTGDYSVGYIATWAKEPDVFKTALERIKDVTSNTLTLVDELMRPREIHEELEKVDESRKEWEFAAGYQSYREPLSSKEEPKSHDEALAILQKEFGFDDERANQAIKKYIVDTADSAGIEIKFDIPEASKSNKGIEVNEPDSDTIQKQLKNFAEKNDLKPVQQQSQKEENASSLS